jgi:hypothetical protein
MAATTIAKMKRFSRRRRKTGHNSADEDDFMIWTNKANRKNNGGAYCLQSGRHIQACRSRNSAKLDLSRRPDLKE